MKLTIAWCGLAIVWCTTVSCIISLLKYFCLLPSGPNYLLEYLSTLKKFSQRLFTRTKICGMNYPVCLHVFCSVPVAGVFVAIVSVAIVSLSQPRCVSVYHCFKAWDGLPDPKGSLLRSVSFVAITSANRVVQRVIVVRHLCALNSNELACARSPWRWAAVEVLTTRNLFPSRPLGPWDCTRGRPAFEVLTCTVSQKTKVSAGRPFSGCTKSHSHFHQLINATGYVLKNS